MSFQSVTKFAAASMANALEDSTYGLFKKLEDCGWTAYNKVSDSSGSKDWIFKSTGEDGTESFYVRITQLSTSPPRVRFRTASYYPASGAPVTDEGNEVGNQNQTHGEWPAGTTAINCWFYGDKDCVAWVMEVGGFYSTFIFGVPARIERTENSGRTTLPSGVTIAGAGSTKLLVGSSANLSQNQKIFVINQGSTNKGNLVRCTIVYIDDSTHITVTNDSGTDTAFDSGALVGMDPLPVFIQVSVYAASKYYGAPSHSFAFIYNPTTTRMTGTDQLTPVHRAGLTSLSYMSFQMQGSAINITDFLDPDANGNRLLQSMMMIGHYNSSPARISGADQLRGRIRRVAHFPFSVGSVAPEDTFTQGSTTWIIMPDERNRSDIYFGHFAIRTSA